MKNAFYSFYLEMEISEYIFLIKFLKNVFAERCIFLNIISHFRMLEYQLSLTSEILYYLLSSC